MSSRFIFASDSELSIVAARGQDGTIAIYGPIANTHSNHILDISVTPTEVPQTIAGEAIEITRVILGELEVIGVLCVEFFLTTDGMLLVNELAPRPHNSGHYSIEGCTVSQYENHIRAITGEVVIEPKLINLAIMVNVLGQNKDVYKLFKYAKDIYVHDYYKNSEKENRKIGHITYIANTKNDLDLFREYISKEIE